MSRRMISPQTLIKSQIADDKNFVDLNEILEKYGTVTENGKSITLQIYNKEATDEEQNAIINDDGIIKGHVVANGSITIMKASWGDVYIQGMLYDWDSGVFIPYLKISSGSFENENFIISGAYEFDLYVIRV